MRPALAGARWQGCPGSGRAWSRVLRRFESAFVELGWPDAPAQSTERYSKNTSPAIGPASGGIAATGRRLLARRPEEFKLDVIRVAENEDGIRNRIRHVSHASVRHSLAVQPARPGVQIRSARDGEREMVKTRSSLIGHFLLVRCMVMQS